MSLKYLSLDKREAVNRFAFYNEWMVLAVKTRVFCWWGEVVSACVLSTNRFRGCSVTSAPACGYLLIE